MTSCFGGILLPVLAVFYFRLWRLFGLLMEWLFGKAIGFWLGEGIGIGIG